MCPPSAPTFGFWCFLCASEVPGEGSIATLGLQSWLCGLSWQRWWGGLYATYKAGHPRALSTQTQKAFLLFFFLIWHKCISEERLIAVLCPWLSSLCWGKSHSWESSWPSLQKSSFNSLQLQNILLEDLFKPFGGWVTHWQTTDGELSSYRKPSEFCKKAKISLFPPCFCGPDVAFPATRWQPLPGTRKRLLM